MRRLSDEGGAVALFTALCMMMLAAFAAFAVNSGLLYDERRQLQNGADAAAFAIAFDCARGTAVKCTHTYASTVSGPTYADSNARDGDATVHAVEPVHLAPDSGEVTVETLSREGAQDAVTLFLGNVLERPTAQVRATATAQWGGAGTGTGLPLAIPLHRWEAVAAWQKDTYPLLTNAQGLFPQDGPFPVLPAPQTFFSLGGAPDYPNGSFGWIGHPQNVQPYCQVSLDVNTFAVDNGNSFGCNHPDASGTGQESDAFLAYAQSRTHPLPVFDSYSTTGGTTRYHVYSWAGIHLTGYRFTGAYAWPSGMSCPGSGSGNSCIRGWLSALDPTPGPIGGPDTGLKRVQLVH